VRNRGRPEALEIGQVGAGGRRHPLEHSYPVVTGKGGSAGRA
jgi:hypothetical protein